MKRFVFLLTLVTCAGLFYVYTEVEAMKIGYTIRKQEEAKTLALDRARALKYNIARLKAPHNLERRLQAQRIELESPKSWQTLLMPGKAARPESGMLDSLMHYRPVFAKFFVGTAQAEAKESSR